MAEIRTNYYIVSSIFLAFSVAFVFAHWVGTTSNRFEMSDFSLYLYLSMLLLVSNGAMLRYMLQRGCQQREWQTSPAHAQPANRTIVSGIAKGGLVVFMIGTILYDSIWLVGTSDCFGVFLSAQCQVKEQVMTLIYLMLKLFFLGEQTMFLLSESHLYAKHGRTNTSRNVYVINSLVNFTIIVYTVLYESRLAIQPESLLGGGVFCTIELFENATFQELRHVTTCMNGTTDIFQTANGLEVYMYTYHSEFCILATTLNMMLWNASSRKVDGGNIQYEISPGSSLNLHARPTFLRRKTSRKEPETDEETGDLLTQSSDENNEEPEEESFLTAEIRRSLHDERTRDPTRSNLGITGGYGSISNGPTCTAVSSDYTASETAMTETMSPLSSVLKGWFAFFKECSNCRECLDPHPDHIYGSDNGCGFLAFVGFAIIIVVSVLTVLQHNNKDGYHLDTPMFVLTVVEFIAMTVASILLAIVTTRTLNRGPSVPRTFSVGSVIIMLSALLMHIFNFLCLIASFNLLFFHREYNNPKHIQLSTIDLVRSATDIMEVCLDCLHVAMQTKLVLNINWIMKRNQSCDVKSSSTTMQCISFLMVGNFSKWVLGTIIEIQDPAVNSSQSVYFGKEAWNAVVYTFYPFVVYFRFHCSMALAEYMLWRRGMKNSDRRHPFLPSIGTFTYY